MRFDCSCFDARYGRLAARRPQLFCFRHFADLWHERRVKACDTKHDGRQPGPDEPRPVGRAGAASRAARLRMLLAPSSPTSHGESTHESAAPACCRFEAPAGYSMLAGQEPCFDGLCLNEAQESEEALLPQK